MIQIRDELLWRCALASWMLALATSPALAASSVSNSFTGFTGDSTQVAIQNSISAAGFNFFDHEVVSKVKLDASGAKFGDGITDSFGDAGRNYIRTSDTDYANHSFVAEISMTIPDNSPNEELLGPSGYFGLGSGDAEPVYRTPEWETELSSVMYWGDITSNEFPFVATMRNFDFQLQLNYMDAPDFTFGTHRLRLTYDWFTKTMVVSADAHYAGGPFVADYVLDAVDTRSMYGATGWPSDAARIFFGGDQGMSFRDFEVTVTTSSLLLGDFDMSGNVTSADWDILRANQYADLSGKTLAEAFAFGDINGDGLNNQADFKDFKDVYEDLNGAGSFARMAAGVPEPATLVMFLSTAALLVLPRRQRLIER